MREVLVGDTLDQYRLDELLARSGMASIFKATDTGTGATVALKVPHMHLESDVVFFERFKREEKIGQRLHHPNVIKVVPPHEKCRMYIAMEYVDGRSLRALMTESKRMPPAEAIEIVAEIAEALGYMHHEGVIHRDVKPENVLITSDQHVKILDFGIALDDSARRLTWFKLSSALGTPDYMAPEQIGGRRGDARTDIYALGTILYEMLTGHLPHPAPNPHSLIRAKTSEEPRPPSYFLPAIDPALEAVILKAIERAPRDRYQTMAEFRDDLRDPSRLTARAAERAAGHGGDGDEGGGDVDGTRTGWRLRVSRRWWSSLTVMAILTALAALVWLSGRPRDLTGASGAAPPPSRGAPP